MKPQNNPHLPLPSQSPVSNSEQIRNISQLVETQKTEEEKPSKKLQNGFLVNQYFQRLMSIDFSLFASIICQLLLLHCYVLMQNIDLSMNWTFQIAIIQFVFSIVLISHKFSAVSSSFNIVLFLILRHFAYNQLQAAYLQNNEQGSAFSLIFNIGLFLIMPLPSINNLTFQDIVNQKYNYVLVIFSVSRLIFCVNYLFLTSKYLTPRSNRICKMYGAYPGLMYCIRSTFKDEPFVFITAVFAISVLVFSILFRISEGDPDGVGASAVYENMVWMTVITMTTVGYGDYSPKTDIGRIIGCVCVSWGVLIVSVMVVVLTNTFSMNRSTLMSQLDQWQALSILKKLEIKKQTKLNAGKYIRQALLRLYRNKKNKTKNREMMKERKLKFQFQTSHRIQTMNVTSQNQIDLYNEMAREFERAFINLQNLIGNNLMIISHLHDQYISNPDQEMSRI